MKSQQRQIRIDLLLAIAFFLTHFPSSHLSFLSIHLQEVKLRLLGQNYQEASWQTNETADRSQKGRRSVLYDALHNLDVCTIHHTPTQEQVSLFLLHRHHSINTPSFLKPISLLCLRSICTKIPFFYAARCAVVPSHARSDEQTVQAAQGVM